MLDLNSIQEVVGVRSALGVKKDENRVSVRVCEQHDFLGEGIYHEDTVSSKGSVT